MTLGFALGIRRFLGRFVARGLEYYRVIGIRVARIARASITSVEIEFALILITCVVIAVACSGVTGIPGTRFRVNRQEDEQGGQKL